RLVGGDRLGGLVALVERDGHLVEGLRGRKQVVRRLVAVVGAAEVVVRELLLGIGVKLARLCALGLLFFVFAFRRGGSFACAARLAGCRFRGRLVLGGGHRNGRHTRHRRRQQRRHPPSARTTLVQPSHLTCDLLACARKGRNDAKPD